MINLDSMSDLAFQEQMKQWAAGPVLESPLGSSAPGRGATPPSLKDLEKLHLWCMATPGAARLLKGLGMAKLRGALPGIAMCVLGALVESSSVAGAMRSMAKQELGRRLAAHGGIPQGASGLYDAMDARLTPAYPNKPVRLATIPLGIFGAARFQELFALNGNTQGYLAYLPSDALFAMLHDIHQCTVRPVEVSGLAPAQVEHVRRAANAVVAHCRDRVLYARNETACDVCLGRIERDPAAVFSEGIPDALFAQWCSTQTVRWGERYPPAVARAIAWVLQALDKLAWAIHNEGMGLDERVRCIEYPMWRVSAADMPEELDKALYGLADQWPAPDQWDRIMYLAGGLPRIAHDWRSEDVFHLSTQKALRSVAAVPAVLAWVRAQM